MPQITFLTGWQRSWSGAGVPLSEATLDTISVVLITLLLSYFTLVFGELVPKRLAMKKSEALALGLSALISTISTLFAPVVAVLTASTNGVLRLLGIDPNADEEEVSEEEIKMMVDRGSQKGVFDSATKEFIQNVFEFDDRTVGEFATHRTELDLLWDPPDCGRLEADSVGHPPHSLPRLRRLGGPGHRHF